MATRLTARGLENLEPEAKRIEVPDDFVTGLYFIVNPTGARSWAVRYRHAGKPKKVTLGRYPAISLADARTLAKGALVEVAAGRDPAGDKQARKHQGEQTRAEQARRERDLVKNVIEIFIEKHAKPRNRSWGETAALFRRNVLPAWGERDIAGITRRDVIEVLDVVMARAPVQANRTFGAVRKLFNWSVERGIVDVSPCTGLRPPAAEKSRDRVLNDDELAAVWRAADRLGWPFGRAVQLLILTGQRRDEVADLRWKEINLGAQLWTIPRERAKNDTVHEVPLSAQAVTVLQCLPRMVGTDLVFTTTGSTPASGYSRAKLRLDKMAAEELQAACGEGEPFPPWRFHDIRRTVASGMARLGVQLPVIEKVLNHTSGTFAGIVGVYQRHSFSDEKREALERWAGHVNRLLAPTEQNVVQLRG